MHSRRFTFHVSLLDDAALISLHGPVDHHAQEALDRLLDELPPSLGTIVVDTGDVPSMDGTGYHFLLRLLRLAASGQARLHTHGWQPQPQRLYALARHVHASEEEPPEGAGCDLRRLRSSVATRAALQRDRGIRQALRRPPAS